MHSALIRRRRITLLGQTLLSLVLLGATTVGIAQETDQHPSDHQCSAHDPIADAGFVSPQSPDFFETYPDGTLPKPRASASNLAAIGALAPTARQPIGSLTGKIIYTSGGHGWTYANGDESVTRWYTQRGVTHEMNEDYGNMDQMTLFAYYCFNAGATVVPMRPVGHQTNEVVVDNVSATWFGPWTDSSSTIYYGLAGQIPYRFASIETNETATATYTPNIPLTGFYPVYAWTRHGTDRTSQLYKVRHTGGESQVRVPHDKVGNGWVYLGTYYFSNGVNSASGAVVISNLGPSPSYGSVVIADAIRFGNGMGDVVPRPKGSEATTTSKYPREEEASRYWIQRSLGQGQLTSIYDAGGSDNDENVGTPPRMAKEMNRADSGAMTDRVYVGFHSNAGGGDGRGCVGLYNDETRFSGSSTSTNQRNLALWIATEMDSDMKLLPLEIDWESRASLAYARTDYAFGEIRGSSIGYEMDATIIEVAFHDNVDDAKLLRDANVRTWMARSTYQGVLRYFDNLDPNFVVTYLPEPPQNVRATGSVSGITISWSAPGSAPRRVGNPTNYVVYTSSDGYGFGNPISVGTAMSITLSNLATDTDLYFRVAAANAGGESRPSEVVGCRRSSNSSAPRVLVVNAFQRLDRHTNLRQTPNAGAWKAPGNSGTMERVLPRANNSLDFVAQYGESINAHGMAFDSCHRTAVSSGLIKLTNYAIVIWAAGQELTGTITSSEQSLLTTYLQTGRGLFVTGSEIAGDLGRASSPAASRSFLTNRLHVSLGADANTNSQSYTATAVSGSIFAGNSSITIDDGTKGIYWVKTPDVVTPAGTGASAALNYSSGVGAAAVQYDGSAGGGRVVFLGFPFETITLPARRNTYMTDILTFLGVPPPVGLPVISVQPQSQTVNRGWDVDFSVAATGAAPLSFQWRYNGSDISGETNNTLTLPNVQTNQAGQYSVIVSNSVGIVSSSTATLVVKIAYETLFSDTFDSNSASLWITNRSSSDTRITFNYNYANDLIPFAPSALGVPGATTRGVKFEANLTNGITAAISMSPNGGSFTGDYDLRFDMWINANGPFPQGGYGSTEHLTAGVGTAGNRTQWGGSGTTADGTWFAVDGEGQAGDTTSSIVDFMIYKATAQQSTNTGSYAAGIEAHARGNNHPYYTSAFPGGQTAPSGQAAVHPNQTGSLAVGTMGMKWRDVRITKRGTTVNWFIDDLRIASVTNATISANNIFVGYWDAFASVSTNPAMSFGLIDNLRVVRTNEVIKPNILAQLQNRSVIQGSNVTFTASASGTAPLSYQWKFNDANIPGATSASYTVTNAQPSHEGDYSFVVTNLAGPAISANATLTVLVPPSILSQPEGQSVGLGEDVGFSVEASGTAPLSYQWLFNGNPIGGANENTLAFTNAQSGNAGNYSVIVTNAAGSITSDSAALFVEMPSGTRFSSFGLGENGQLELLVAGAAGRSLLIETSIDLLTWTNFTNIVIGDEGTALIVDELSLTNAQKFYRSTDLE